MVEVNMEWVEYVLLQTESLLNIAWWCISQVAFILFSLFWIFLKSYLFHAWKQFPPSSDPIFRVSTWVLGRSGQNSAFRGLQIDTNPNVDKHKISHRDNQWFQLKWSKDRKKVGVCSLSSSHRKKDRGDLGSNPCWCIEWLCVSQMYCMLVLVFFTQGLTLYT